MKILGNPLTDKKLKHCVVLAWALVPLSAWPLSAFAQSNLATQTEEVEKLKAAEYEDYINAMNFENDNQKLGNYYLHKGAQIHHLIDQMETGQPVSKQETDKALDNSNAENYDNRPPVPLDDEIGDGY
jgi:hypothetical protein